MSTEITPPASSLFGSIAAYFVPTVYAEEGKEVAKQEDKEEDEDKEEGGEEEEAEGGDEEEEEDEPEDQAPAIREECENSAACQPAKKHFQHCADKIEAGKGWHGEDCVEELFHLMHCVDACAAPKVFKKLV